MPTADQVALLIFTLSLAILAPGPAIISASQTAFARGRSVALPYGLGLGFGASLWGLCSVLGLTAVFTVVPALYMGLKIFGGLYLLWVATGLWRAARSPMPEAAPARFGTGFWGGVALNLSNPKPALFYSALFLAIFPGGNDTAGRIVIYGLCLATELFWYACVTYLLSAAAPRRYYARLKVWIDRTSGALLGALGIGLIVETLRDSAR